MLGSLGLPLDQKSSQNPTMVLFGFLWYCIEICLSTTMRYMAIYGFFWLGFVLSRTPIWMVDTGIWFIHVVPVVISSVEAS